MARLLEVCYGFICSLAISIAQCVREPNFHAEWIVLKILAVVKASTVLLTWIDVFTNRIYNPTVCGQKLRGREISIF